ncbi:MAG: GNAT family N-acetyltransferase [Gemmatimonadetes bacterium]|nr:GNAT family N-acetyltransferase [Gemmatimonadota bacterium]
MSEVEIRHMRTEDEFAASVDLQRDTWGWSFSDVVPLSMLQISVKMGGVCLGAFGSRGELMGFVYGITGVRKGELAHWSHMLAVRPEVRDQGIGKRLKLAQADALRALGVRTVYWTFDPLVARNAHLNLNVLGVTIDEYVPDMYGRSDSELHQLGTDRFIVRWSLQGEGAAPDGADYTDAETVEVLIPADIEAVEARSVDEALEWRRTTRRAFTRLLGAGASVAGFFPDREYGRYVLVRKPGS